MTTKQISAKYTGKCVRCGGVILSGTRCNWAQGEGVSHIACPAKQNGAQAPAASNGKVTVTMGVFRKDGRIYVVKPNKEKTAVYAKEIVESPARMTESGLQVDFEARYAPGVVYRLTEADRWDIADAQDFLTKFARCIVCGRHLKAAKSVANAIGPVCAKYFAHNKTYTAKPCEPKCWHAAAPSERHKQHAAALGKVFGVEPAAAVNSIAKSPKTLGEMAATITEQPIVRNGFDRYEQLETLTPAEERYAELLEEANAGLL